MTNILKKHLCMMIMHDFIVVRYEWNKLHTIKKKVTSLETSYAQSETGDTV